MRGHARLAAALLAAATSLPALAAPDAAAQREIDHLLAYLASSGCRFVRGGVEHDAREARDHLALKLDVARPLLGSADAFVERVATVFAYVNQAHPFHCVLWT